MEAPRVLIDTSIIIEHLRKQDRRKSILYRISNDFAFSTSTVVEFELYAGATDKQKRLDIGVVLNWFTVLPFTSDVANTAASLFQICA